MEARHDSPDQPSRRQFVQRAAIGASVLGLGAVAGTLALPSKSPSTTSGRERELGPKFSYDVSGLAEVDPKFIAYREEKPILSGFEELRAVRVGRNGRIITAGDQGIRIFDASGSKTSEFTLTERPRCLAAGKDASIYVGMSRCVQVFNDQGQRQAQWDNLGANAVITSIAAGAENVFVADAGNRVVVRYDLSGKQLGLIGKKNPEKNILGFVVPSPYFEVSVGTDGWVWAVNPAHHRLEAYTFDGEPRSVWGESANTLEGFCGCCNPIHFTRLSDGRFVTAEKGLPRVKVYSATGQFQSVVAAPSEFARQMENPRSGKAGMSLAADESGRIYLADSTTGQIRVFTPKA